METDSCRERLAKYCAGNGVDLGFAGCPVVRSAIGVDRAENDPRRAINPESGPTQLVGDVDNLYWFRDGVLDYVFSSHCLEDFVDVEKVLKEWLRVLKPGGFLVLFLPDEQVYRSVTPDHIRNQAHQHLDFSLQFVKNCLYNIGYDENTVVHQLWPVPNNPYSFDLVVQKPVGSDKKEENAAIAPATVPATVPVAPNVASYENKKLIQLGRYGDLINILPIAKDIAEKVGKPVPIICKREHADLLEGVSYAVPEFAAIERFKPEEAASPSCLNTHAAHPSSPRRIPYNLQAWEQAGYLERWTDLFPVFDRRCKIREISLAETWISYEKPVLLYTLEAISSRMSVNTGLAVRRLLEESFADSFQLLDAGPIRAPRPYDMLGLVDLASAVITIDTMLLHLCTATNVPVIALVSDHPPTFWRASATKGNILRTLAYNKVETSWNHVVRLINSGYRRLTWPQRKIAHVVPVMTGSDPEVQRRLKNAEDSWQPFHAQGADFVPFHCNRVFQMGTRTLPYLKDALRAGVDACSSANDIICLTNADIILSPGFYGALQHRMTHSDYCCSFRMEFEKVEPGKKRCGCRSSGRDMFAFKRDWLLRHFDEIPDFLIGVGGWDYALAMWFRVLSGRSPQCCDPSVVMPDIEMEYGFIWHEEHKAGWYTNTDKSYDSARKHNRDCLRAFFSTLELHQAHQDIS